jgi:hypothetical protein
MIIGMKIMSNYFDHFPKTVYNLGDQNSLDSIANLTVNYTFIGDLLNNTSAYYEYSISDGDTPEIVSHKIYGTPYYHWIILKINNMVDVNNDWPMDSKTFDTFINQKYNSMATAMSNTHSYNKIETTILLANNEQISQQITEIDSTVYAALSASTTNYLLKDNTPIKVVITKNTKSKYEYEFDLNESKRSIKMLRQDFISPVVQEFHRIMDNA